MSYADQVIIGGLESKDVIPNLLHTSDLGKHTSIIYLMRPGGGKEVKVFTYLWDHNSQRPNCSSFLMACPSCHHIYSWRKIATHLDGQGSSFNLKCTTSLGNGQKCKGTWTVPARPTSSIVVWPHAGTWRTV